MIDDDEVDLKKARRHQIHHYIKLRPKAPGVRAKNLIPNVAIIWNCGLGESAGASRLNAPSGGRNPSQMAPTTGVFNFGSPWTKGGGVQSCLT